MVILCFEKRFSKQNSVIRLKSSILAPASNFRPLPNFWTGYGAGIHVIWTSVPQTAPKEVVNLLSGVKSINNGESNEILA